jgi:MFS family permease
VVWYTGHFQALFFLTLQLKVDQTTANLMMCAALALGAPLFVVFGALSDRIGRKPIILSGCLLAALATLPLFEALTAAANPGLAAAQERVVTTLSADPSECAWQFDPTGTARRTSGCDVAKHRLSDRAVRYTTLAGSGPAVVGVGAERIDIRSDDEAGLRRLDAALNAAGYPPRADPQRIDHLRVVGILWLLIVFVTMVYGPIAALLVEMFETRVRCSSVSLPYHLGNGWFGGLLPSTALAIAVQTGNMYSGLWYPIAVALATCAIGIVFVKETKDVDLDSLRI